MMLDYFIYKQTPAGRFAINNKPDESGELLGVSSFTPGTFEVKAKGKKPAIGDDVLLPVKGSKQLSMKLKVEAVEPLITPIGSWSARCCGPDRPDFNVKFADIRCDECAAEYQLEFVEFSGNTHADALAGMNMAGWAASEQKQVCPRCK